mmetsp:Transcript_59275/g.105364  ORF Transcript_59275/g.105364 Transcript_59275/m.105364 type:complete len:230 (+) Transcript_59275:306-995(+)
MPIVPAGANLVGLVEGHAVESRCNRHKVDVGGVGIIVQLDMAHPVLAIETNRRVRSHVIWGIQPAPQSPPVIVPSSAGEGHTIPSVTIDCYGIGDTTQGGVIVLDSAIKVCRHEVSRIPSHSSQQQVVSDVCILPGSRRWQIWWVMKKFQTTLMFLLKRARNSYVLLGVSYNHVTLARIKPVAQTHESINCWSGFLTHVSDHAQDDDAVPNNSYWIFPLRNAYERGNER